MVFSKDFISFFGFKEEIDLSKKVLNSIDYTLSLFSNCSDLNSIRADSVLRNNVWKDEGLKFFKSVNYNLDYSSQSKEKKHYHTSSGSLDSKFYRKTLKYDLVIPKSVYIKVFNYYFIQLKENNKKEISFLEKNFDKIFTFCYLISHYNGKYISYLFTKRAKTPLAVKLIISFIGRDYKSIINFLERISVIDVDKMYIPAIWDKKAKTDKKGVCRHYNFTEPVGDEYIVYQVTKRNIITKVYNIFFKDDIEYVNENSNTIKDRELNKWFSKSFELSSTAIDNRKDDYDGFSYYYSKINIADPIDKYRDFTIGRDKFGHRLYHPFLNINKKLRSHILINNSKDNCVIDLNNSHPYFFSLLLDKNFLSYVKDLLTETEYNIFNDNINDDGLKENIAFFKRITASGNYYSFLEENIKTVEDIKRVNMYYFYGKMNKRNLLYKFFDSNFSFINNIKYKIIKSGGYKRLCQILQRVESKIMIDEVFLKLSKNYSIIPLHDAIMCNTKNFNYIKKYIISIFKNIGVEFLPAFEKNSKNYEIRDVYDKIKEKNFNFFVNKGIIIEQLNDIIKSVGINNRVFRESMLIDSIKYIDTRFEKLRFELDNYLVNRYYDLRIMFDNNIFDIFDSHKLYELYKETNLTKKKFYSRNVIDFVKVNPIEFFNHQYGTKFKTRLIENKYIY